MPSTTARLKLAVAAVILGLQCSSVLAAGPIYAYLDSISPGWSDWSWGTQVSNDTFMKKSGAASAQVRISDAWGGLSLSESPVSMAVSGLSEVSFDINPGAADNVDKVSALRFSLQNGDVVGPQVAIGEHAFPALSANAWSRVSIPVNKLKGALAVLDRLNLQDGLGQGDVAFNIDNIALVPGARSIQSKSITYSTPDGDMTAQVAYPGGLATKDRRPVILMVPGWDGSGNVAAIMNDFWTQEGYITLSIGFKDKGNWNSNVSDSAIGALDALFADLSIPARRGVVAIDGESYGGIQAVQIAEELKSRYQIKAVLAQDAGYAWPGTCTSKGNGCISNPNANIIGLKMVSSPYSVAMIQNKDDTTFPIDSCDDNNCGTRNRANYHAVDQHVYSNCEGFGGHGIHSAGWTAWTINAMKTMLHVDQRVPVFPGWKSRTALVGNSCRNILHTHDQFLTDYQGRPVILRGVNFGGYWIYDVNNPSIAFSMVDEIAKTGANAARLVWQGNQEFSRDPAVLDKLMARITDDKMIVVPELHNSADGSDMTCSSFASGAVDKAVRYWTSPKVMEVLKKYEGKMVLNIANEVGSPDEDPSTQVDALLKAYRPAILAIRQAGLRSPLMIDAPFCGQDGMALARAAFALLQADPLRNIVFSVHAYWNESIYRPRINRLISAFKGKTFIFGEFSSALDCSLNARTSDYKTILNMSDASKIGNFAWNWGGVESWDTNGNPCPSDGRGMGYARQDMTDIGGTFDKLSGWGLDIANNIRLTSVRPGIF